MGSKQFIRTLAPSHSGSLICPASRPWSSKAEQRRPHVHATAPRVKGIALSLMGYLQHRDQLLCHRAKQKKAISRSQVHQKSYDKQISARHQHATAKICRNSEKSVNINVPHLNSTSIQCWVSASSLSPGRCRLRIHHRQERGFISLAAIAVRRIIVIISSVILFISSEDFEVGFAENNAQQAIA